MAFIVFFYRANNAKNDTFEQAFDEFLSKTVNQNKLNICVGDLNLNMNENSKSVSQFKSICDMHGVFYISDFFTRITNNSQTKIDVILTNDTDRVKCNTIPNEKISDHETIKIDISHEEKRDFSKKQIVISWKNYSKDQLIENLRKLNWYNFEMLELHDMINVTRQNLELAVKPIVSML